MRKPHGIARTCVLAGAFALLTFLPAAAAPVASRPVLAAYGGRSLAFEPNQGQASPSVAFLARGAGFGLALSPAAAVLEIGVRRAAHRGSPPAGAAAHTLRMELLGADAAARATVEGKLAGESNYLVGAPARWRTHVPTYARVRFAGVYPGVDLVYYGNGGRLEHDFVVAPGADPGAIRLAVAGADRADLDPSGDLVLRWGDGEVRLRKPAAYQEIDGRRREVASAYRLLDGGGPTARRVGFVLASYDRSRPLVIDPLLVYSTYLGGSGDDQAGRIAVDPAGNAYVTGYTVSPDFPVVDALQPSVRSFDAFVTKLDPRGKIVYSTFLGGSGAELANGIAVDAAGDAYVTGETSSPDFPRVHPLGPPVNPEGGPDAFVVKLDPTGSSFLYATNLGGAKYDSGYDVTLDAQGHAYVVGLTLSPDFPTVAPLFSSLRRNSDGFVAKLAPDGSALEYSTYFAGDSPITAIAVDAPGFIYLGGDTQNPALPTVHAVQSSLHGIQDAFAAKLNPAGSAFVYCTYLGGSSYDFGVSDLVVDAAGNAYLTGATPSPDFPLMRPLQSTLRGPTDAFVTELSASGSLLYSTYLGGTWLDGGSGIAVGPGGEVYVGGTTNSGDFPLVDSLHGPCASPDSTPLYCDYDAFVTVLDLGSSRILASTLYGGRFEDGSSNLALDRAGNVYIAGVTDSRDLPAVEAAQASFGGDFDAFVAKIAFDRPPDCSRAVASPATLWPPNGRLVPTSILGVTDPEGGPLTVAVTGVVQDEPTGGALDASGLGTATASLRAERAGSGDGRVYRVQITATAAGLSCTGSVAVCVPHDAAHRTCGDGGALYRSTDQP